MLSPRVGMARRRERDWVSVEFSLISVWLCKLSN